MLFKLTEVDIQFVERGEELSEGAIFGELREGVDVLEFLWGLTPWQKNIDKSSCVKTFLRGGFDARGEGRGRVFGLRVECVRVGTRGQRREEVHLKSLREAGRGAESDVHVTVQDLDDIRTRCVHTTSELGLIKPKLLHSLQHGAKKHRTSMIYTLHS